MGQYLKRKDPAIHQNEISQEQLDVSQEQLALAKNRGWREFISLIFSAVALIVSIAAFYRPLPEHPQMNNRVNDCTCNDCSCGNKDADVNNIFESDAVTETVIEVI